MKLIVLVFAVLFSFLAFAESESIKSKILQYARSNDFENRLDEQEQEIRRLIGKIEVLEHKINLLTKNSDIPVPLEESAKIEDVNSPDVFDVTLIKDIPNPEPKAKPVAVSQDAFPDKQAYDLALASYKDNKINEAKDKFKNFIYKHPTSSMISNAYFWYGECFFKQKDYNGAAINYLKGYKEAPKGPKASDGLLKLAISLGELKKTQEACNMFAKLDNEFPNNRAAASKKMAEDAKLKFGCKTKSK